MRERETSAFGTVASILGVLVALALFCLLFTAFLIVPFFVFIIAIVALMVSEWRRD